MVEAGVDGVVGEFHSVVAEQVSTAAELLEIPFVCSSATIDLMRSRRRAFTFCLAPPQSHGWRLYAAFLAATGHEHVAAFIQRDICWESGATVLETTLARLGGRFTRIDLAPDREREFTAGLRRLRPDALLLLVGYPAPLREIVCWSRREFGNDLLVGDPAGRAAFAHWWGVLGRDGVGVPYLAYLSSEQTATGARLARNFRAKYGREPTFVAYEGYDAVLR